jgi:hypothetical protein
MSVGLFHVQACRFQQYLVRYAYLADVVQGGRALNGLNVVGVHAYGLGDQGRIPRHANHMVSGFLVAKLTGAGQPDQGLSLALPDFPRGILNHAFEHPPAVFKYELLAPQGDQVAAARHAFARVDGLVEKVGYPCIRAV